MIEGLIVDNFAGGGGASKGIEMALGRPIDIAINHDPAAIAMHQANHPHAKHYCQSVYSVDPLEVTGGKHTALAWFSPDCTHHSKARGGKPREKNIRDLAWVVVNWAERVEPDIIGLENVEEFRDWGPLCPDGFPIKDQKGETFDFWSEQIRKRRYRIDFKEIRACDFGVGTIRKRLVMFARRDRKTIVWVKPTHGAPGSGLLPYKTAADVIDFSLPCPSIFTRKRPLAENTLKRIARGMKKFVFDAEEPFIVTCNHGGDRFRGQGLTDPLCTITASRDAHGLVIPYVQHVQHASAKNGVMPADEPLRTVTAHPKGGGMALVSAFIAKHYGGMTGVDIRTPFPTITTSGTQNTVVAAHLERQFGKSSGADIDQPLPTVMPGGGGKTALVASHLTKFRGTCRHGQPVTEPVPTITAGGTHIGEVRAFLMKYYGTGGQDQTMNDPLHTVTAKGRFGLVEVETCKDVNEVIRYHAWWTARFLDEYMDADPEPVWPHPRKSSYTVGDCVITDIGMRMLTPRELFRAQGFPEDYIIDPEFNGKPMTKTEQVAKCGNSVPPGMIAPHLKANFETFEPLVKSVVREVSNTNPDLFAMTSGGD